MIGNLLGSWLFFAVLAPLLWAISTLVDANLVRRPLGGALVLSAIAGIFSGLPAIMILALGKVTWPGLGLATFGVSIGILSVLVYLPYYRALEFSSPEGVILMWNLSPVFVALIARFILAESLLGREYLAIGLLVCSSLAAAMHLGSGWRLSPAFVLMIGASLLSALDSVLQKVIFDYLGFSDGFFWIALGALVCGLGLWSRGVRVSASGKTGLRLMSSLWPVGLVLVVNAGLDVLAGISRSFAISIGPVSLVKAVGGLQPAFILLFSAALAVRYSTARQGWTGGALALKLGAVLLAIVGLGLIGLGS